MKNESIFKKVIYAGVGLAAVTVDKIEETVNELVDKGKLSDSEGKKIVKDFFAKTDEKREEFEEKLKTTVKEVVDKFNFLKKDDYEVLKKRVKELEDELAKKTDDSKTSPGKVKATVVN
ncbi:MAG: hypothetical protein ABII90_10710 [Bacteroidota bacterium]